MAELPRNCRAGSGLYQKGNLGLKPPAILDLEAMPVLSFKPHGRGSALWISCNVRNPWYDDRVPL